MGTPLANTSELVLPSDGGDTDVWGLENNSLHAGWDRFLGGAVNHDMSAASWTLTNDEAQNGVIWLTGSSPVARSVVLPFGKFRKWVVLNLVSGAGNYMQVAQGSSTINIPQGTIALIASLPGALLFAGPPVEASTGGFLPSVIQPGFGYFGPGMFFSNREVGFGSPAAGYLNFYLSAANAQAELRLQFNNTAAIPLIAAMRAGPIWDTGLFFPGGVEVAVSAQGQLVARFTNGGVAVGAANGPAGPGTVNAGQYFRNGAAMPFQFPISMTFGLGTFQQSGHGIGGPPDGVFGKLRCVAGDLGYVPGDITDAAVSQGLAYGADATTGWCCAEGAVTLPRKGTGAVEAIAKGRWALDLLLAWP